MKTTLMITVADGVQLGIEAECDATGSNESDLYRCITELEAKIDDFNNTVKPGSGPDKSLAGLLSSVALFMGLRQGYAASQRSISKGSMG